MAGVVIKEEAFALVNELAKALGWDPDLMLGKVAKLWARSQTLEITSASPEEIAIWMGVPVDQAEKVTAAMAARTVGLLRPARRGQLEIVGNKSHIARNKENRAASREGGKRTREKWAALKKQREQGQDAEPHGLASALPTATPPGKATSTQPYQPAIQPTSQPSVLASQKEAGAVVDNSLPPVENFSFEGATVEKLVAQGWNEDAARDVLARQWELRKQAGQDGLARGTT